MRKLELFGTIVLINFADSESSFSFAIMDLPETWLGLNSTKKELHVRLVRLEPHGKEQHKTVALICFCYFICLDYYVNSKVLLQYIFNCYNVL